MLTLLCGLERLGASWMRYRWGETSSRHCQLQGRQVGNWVATGVALPGVEQEKGSHPALCEASAKSFNELLGSYV